MFRNGESAMVPFPVSPWPRPHQSVNPRPPYRHHEPHDGVDQDEVGEG